jgi:hypothetical protein
MTPDWALRMASAGRTACTGEHVMPGHFYVRWIRYAPSSEFMNVLRLPVTLAVAVTIAGCAPSFDALYRDFVRPHHLEGAEMTVLRPVIVAALEEAGWTVLEETHLPVVATEPRTHARWLAYRVTVQVEVLPMGSNHVRVLIHPFREYAWGTRSRIPYLTGPVKRAFVPELERAFARAEIVMLASPRHGTR